MLQEGRLTGRKCVISNFLDSKGVAEKFSSSAERQVRCKFSDCIREAWATVASHVRSMTRRSQHAGSINTSESAHGHCSHECVGESAEACAIRSQPLLNYGLCTGQAVSA